MRHRAFAAGALDGVTTGAPRVRSGAVGGPGYRTSVPQTTLMPAPEDTGFARALVDDAGNVRKELAQDEVHRICSLLRIDCVAVFL
jgi:hypothetical protein